MVKELGQSLVIVPVAMGLCASPVHAQNLPPGANADELPDRVDLRSYFDNWGLARREQGSRTTCSVLAVVGALEFAFAKSQGTALPLSAEFLNWAANQESGDATDGGFFSSMWDGYSAYGICLEQDMPYQPEFEASRKPGEQVLALAKSKLSSDLRSR